MEQKANLIIIVALLAGVLLSACATTGPNSPRARAVLYPNSAFTAMGELRAGDEVNACTAKATAAGLTPDEKDNAVAQGAARGATVGGVAAAVGAAVRGRSLEHVIGSGAAGIAVGGAAGATAGALRDKPNQTYRHFVQRCLRDKGLDVIGWN